MPAMRNARLAVSLIFDPLRILKDVSMKRIKKLRALSSPYEQRAAKA